ncbi:MAG: hypothetical protein CFE23_03635 [Flavobacterium sp. BFFFF1]|nr:MAG: hypothetical protein CFE23_03635 [Flavobacterium sp. BFFFF1]
MKSYFDLEEGDNAHPHEKIYFYHTCNSKYFINFFVNRAMLTILTLTCLKTKTLSIAERVLKYVEKHLEFESFLSWEVRSVP